MKVLLSLVGVGADRNTWWSWWDDISRDSAVAVSGWRGDWCTHWCTHWSSDDRVVNSRCAASSGVGTADTHEIWVLVVAIVKQPLLGASSVREGEDTATGRSDSTVTVGGTALGITGVFSSEPNTGLIEWNTWLGWWLDQDSRGGSVTVDSTNIGCSSSNTASAVGVYEDTSTDSIGRLLGAALLEASACLNLRVGLGRNSLLGRSQRDEGKDKEDLLECVHV